MTCAGSVVRRSRYGRALNLYLQRTRHTTIYYRELYRHKRGEDRPPGAPLMAYVCEECDKVLGSMCALHTHKKMHKVSKPVSYNVYSSIENFS